MQPTAPCSWASLRLEAAPAAAVAGDDDLALDVDAALLERLIVVRHAVIDVDQRRGDVAVALIGDVGRQRVRGVAYEVGSPGDRRLLPAERGRARARPARAWSRSASDRARRRSRYARPSPIP